MNTAAKTPVEESKNCPVRMFAIEADHPRNSDLLLQGILGERLRSRIVSSRTVRDARSGETMVPEDQARHLGKYPEIPGMQLHVNPSKLAYRIHDPLHDDEELCNRIKKQMDRESLFRTDAKLKGVPEKTGTLTNHRMKTLVREMYHLVKSGEARVIKGKLPEMEEIDRLEGRYLTNPGSLIPNGQPQFEDQMEDWVDTLNRTN